MDLETLMTSPDGFGIETATLLQRATCRIIQGVPLDDLLARASASERAQVEAAIGCDVSVLPNVMPVEAVLVAPVRTFKTMLACGKDIAGSQMVDVSLIRPGQEPPRTSVLSTSLDTARTYRGHLETIKTSPLLRALYVGDTADSVFLRHPSGLIIELTCVAAARGGYSIHSRWSSGVSFLEAPGWYSTDRIISLEENRDVALGRLLPNAQVLYEGAPWQPSGQVYDAVEEHYGKPSADIVVIWPRSVEGVTPAAQLNPFYWTPEREAQVQRKTPGAYRMHVLNEFGAHSSGFFPYSARERAVQKGRLTLPAPLDGTVVIAADPAFSENGDKFGFAVASHLAGAWNPSTQDRLASRIVVHEAGAWRADRQPREMAARLRDEVCRRYRKTHIFIDQFSSQTFIQLCRDVGLTAIKVDWLPGERDDEDIMSKSQRYRAFLHRMLADPAEILLPDVVELNRDMAACISTLMPGGTERIEVPRTRRGHGDCLSAVVMAATEAARRKPQLPASIWSREEYDRRYMEWRAKCAALGDHVAHPIFNDDGRVWAFEDLALRAQHGPTRRARGLDGLV